MMSEPASAPIYFSVQRSRRQNVNVPWLQFRQRFLRSFATCGSLLLLQLNVGPNQPQSDNPGPVMTAFLSLDAW